MSEPVIAPLDRVGANFAAAVERAEAPPKRWMSRRTMLVGAGFAALVLMAAVPAYISLGGHRVASLSTAEAIEQVARAAMENPLPFAREDQFQYTRSRGTFVTTFGGGYNARTKKAAPPYSVLETSEREAWVSVKRLGALRERRVGVKWVTDRDRRIARSQDQLKLFRPTRRSVAGLAPNGEYYFLGKEMTRSEFESAPSDPKSIYEQTQESIGEAGQGPDDGVWQALAGPLRESALPTNIRAGMVRALGMIPGVTTLGLQRDPLGREGIAISRIHNGVRDTLLFDQTNSRLLHENSKVVKKTNLAMGWPVGTVIADYLAYDQAVVGEIPRSVRNKLPSKAD